MIAKKPMTHAEREARRKEIRRLHREGRTYSEIAVMLGVSHSLVYTTARRKTPKK